MLTTMSRCINIGAFSKEKYKNKKTSAVKKIKKYPISLIVLIEVALSIQDPADDIRWLHYVYLNRKHYANDSEEYSR
jgi:hypothetical protein